MPIPSIILAWIALATSAVAGTNVGPPEIRDRGVLGFPQADASVLCDNDGLRLSVWSDRKYLYVQAVVWKDGDGAIGESRDGRAIGDRSQLLIDVDANGEVSPDVDRTYSLNPWPRMPGLYYHIVLEQTAVSGLQGDSKGRGAIRYIKSAGTVFRVDCYLIPLGELGPTLGGRVGIAYEARSPTPALRLNSLDTEGDSSPVHPLLIPQALYHDVRLVQRESQLDISSVPRGRADPVAAVVPTRKAPPRMGVIPPELEASNWLNAESALKLAELRGKVVVVDFWSTWCGPCIANIARLNELQSAHRDDGLVLVGMTDQNESWIKRFLKTRQVNYALGTGSELGAEYGVEHLPQAFVIGRDGRLRWRGRPSEDGFETAILAALSAAPRGRQAQANQGAGP